MSKDYSHLFKSFNKVDLNAIKNVSLMSRVDEKFVFPDGNVRQNHHVLHMDVHGVGTTAVDLLLAHHVDDKLQRSVHTIWALYDSIRGPRRLGTPQHMPSCDCATPHLRVTGHGYGGLLLRLPSWRVCGWLQRRRED